MKPILFNGEMVREIFKGRKTQTRRVIKVNNPDEFEAINDCRLSEYGSSVPCYLLRIKATEERGIYYPKYDVGDILWVRETWAEGYNPDNIDENGNIPLGYCYRASGDDISSEFSNGKWKPSIFMPKAAARLFLKVTNVRAERLQEIKGKDARAEGIGEPYACRSESGYEFEMSVQFKELWDSINGKKYPWESNPWVWVYEFERTEKPHENPRR